MADTADLFKFTRARFVCNEQYELARRTVVFNLEGLKRVAASATGSRSCAHVQKCPDGMFNKAFVLTMDDGRQVVAKIPNPNAGLSHFTVASEVATMEFMRTVLSTPVPKVFAWSSKRDNEVQAEYIIMEKVLGVTLDTLWPDMSLGDRFQVTKKIAVMQATWASVTFKQYGSLYFADDLEKPAPLTYCRDGTEVSDSRFAIGPSIARDQTDDGRESIQFDRGPWGSVRDFHVAIGHRERQSINEISRLPKSPIAVRGPGLYTPTRERKLRAVNTYLKLIDDVLPNDALISAGCLFHSDLHEENIFVDPNDATNIVGLIDWQSSEICPMFTQLRQPYIISYDGPPLEPFEQPEPLGDLSGLDESAAAAAKAAYFDKALAGAYKTFMYKTYPDLYRAIKFRETSDFEVLLLARNLLVDGEAQYLARLVELSEEWKSQSREFPVAFTEEEKSEIAAAAASANEGIAKMQRIRDTLGGLFPELGSISADKYDECKRALRQIKSRLVAQYAKNEREVAEWEEQWPFDD